MTSALSGRIQGKQSEYVFDKPLSFEDGEMIDAFLSSAKRKGCAAMKIENDEQVKLFIVRK